MSIFPNNKSILWIWQIAALNPKLPEVLINEKELEEWRTYIKALSPAQQLTKFAEALDAFHASLPVNNDFKHLSTQEGESLFAKWLVAREFSAAIDNRLRFVTEELHKNQENLATSDIELAIHYVTDLIKGINADATDWDQRRALHRKACEEPFRNFIYNAFNTYRPYARMKDMDGPSLAP